MRRRCAISCSMRGARFPPGEGILPVPRCFRDDEEPGEEVVEEEVRGGGGRAPRHGLDPFESLPVQRVGELVRQGVGRFEGAVGAPWVTEGEDIRVRQDPRRSRRFGGPASSAPGTVGEENGSRGRCWIDLREAIPRGRAPAVTVEGAQRPVDK